MGLGSWNKLRETKEAGVSLHGCKVPDPRTAEGMELQAVRRLPMVDLIATAAVSGLVGSVVV